MAAVHALVAPRAARLFRRAFGCHAPYTAGLLAVRQNAAPASSQSEDAL